MSLQELFTAAEWRTLQFAPLWTFTAVAGADQNIDEKEVEALGRELSRAGLFKEPLVQEVLSSVVRDLGNIMKAYTEDPRMVIEGLQEVASVLAKRVPARQAENFKRAMLYIGHQVAKASGGGIFGRREKISDEEKAAIVLVAVALDLTL